MNPSTEQLYGQLRIIVGAIVGFAAGRKIIGEDMASLLVTVIPIGLPMVWSWIANSHHNLIRIVAGLHSEGIKGIIVDPATASDGVKAAVEDVSLPTVVTAGSSAAAKVAKVT